MFKRLFPFLLGIVCFALIFNKVDWPKTWGYLKTTNIPLCVASVACLILMIYIKGIRWSYLIKMQGRHYSIWNCFLIYMSTLAMGNFTPGRAGDFAKILYLNKDLKFSTGTSMSSTLVDRVFDLYLLLILGGIGILAYPTFDPNLIKAVWAFFALLIVVTLLAFNQKIGGALLKAVFQRMMKQEHKDKMDKLFDDFHRGMECFYKPAILYPIFLSLLAYVSFFGGSYLIALAMNLPISILYLSFCLSVVNIVSLLSFLGMGTRDGALYILFKMVSLQDQAEAFSMLFFFIGLVVFSLVGLICFYLKPIDLSFLSKSKAPSARIPVSAIQGKASKAKPAKKHSKK
ncbi:MAG TPA: lysylphosphatidylglycerol synthase transmembrane domain-containing protein [bacterium]|nr:lysylphosphatidylglycerol synthase transmembrane domain-containing protein [bacterium]